MDRRELDTPERVGISREGAALSPLNLCARSVSAPRWPDPAYPPQIHLDLYVDDARGAQALALRLGTIRLPDLGGSCPVYADPAGHPLCLCSEGR